MYVQLTFLDEIKIVDDVRKQRETLDKMRKKLFAENNALKKEVREIREELEFLKSNICKGKVVEMEFQNAS
jgi:septal ring factor EnvC (AmiA/AmiB activator)